MDLVQALALELGITDSGPAEFKALPKPGSCPVCNDCEGWEGNAPKPVGNTIALKKWHRPPFRMKATVQGLLNSAASGCPACAVFYDAIIHFVPEIDGNVNVEACLPVRSGLLQLCVMPSGVTEWGVEEQYELFTTQGILTRVLRNVPTFICTWLRNQPSSILQYRL